MQTVLPQSCWASRGGRSWSAPSRACLHSVCLLSCFALLCDGHGLDARQRYFHGRPGRVGLAATVGNTVYLTAIPTSSHSTSSRRSFYLSNFLFSFQTSGRDIHSPCHLVPSSGVVVVLDALCGTSVDFAGGRTWLRWSGTISSACFGPRFLLSSFLRWGVRIGVQSLSGSLANSTSTSPCFSFLCVISRLLSFPFLRKRAAPLFVWLCGVRAEAIVCVRSALCVI